MASDLACSIQDARDVVRSPANDSRVWSLLAGVELREKQSEIFSLLMTLEPAEALAELMRMNITTVDATELVFYAALDKRDDLMLDFSHW